MTPRLKREYQEEIIPAMMKEFNYRNAMEVPRMDKIVVNIGLGEGIQNAKAIDSAMMELAQITGQHPVVTKAKKSIAAFNDLFNSLSSTFILRILLNHIDIFPVINSFLNHSWIFSFNGYSYR